MNFEYRIEATIIVGKATTTITAPSPEEALKRAKELTLGAWKIDPDQKLTVHPTTTLEKLVEDSAGRFIGLLAQELGEMKDLMEGLHPDVAASARKILDKMGNPPLLMSILGIENGTD